MKVANRRLASSLFVALFLCAVPPFHTRAQQTSTQDNDNVIAIVGATVVDGTGTEAAVQTVVIRGERIAAMGKDAEIPQGARIIHAEGKTLLPGLFDLHTHLPYATASGVAPDWPKNLKAYLYCGVTSVNDFGTYGETFEPMRRLIASGQVEAPRLMLAARFTTPDGHGAEGGRSDIFSLEVLTPREARAAVRQVLPYKPDAIKVFTDGWRYGAAPDMTSMDEATLAALVDEAHKNNLKVLTHTVTLARAKIAARAGVDALAHGVGDAEVDLELIELMKQHGTTYVPTMAVYEPRGSAILSPILAAVLDPAVRAAIKPALTPPVTGDEKANQASIATAEATESGAANPARAAEIRRLRDQRWRFMVHNVGALHKAGIRVATGTDAGVTGTHHGWATLRELELLVKGGLTPLEAITAATGASAKTMHVEDSRGTIAAGKLADLVLIGGTPHRDINDIEKVERVFLGGREIDREKLAREIASAEQSPLASIKVEPLVDDFESADGRSQIHTLWINATDPGLDNSHMVFGRVLRTDSDHALAVMARMAEKDRPYVRMVVPLSAGAVEPVDLSGYHGVSFEVRGEGSYKLIVPTRGARDSGLYQAPFQASARWTTVKIDFSALKPGESGKGEPWQGKEALMLMFEVARKAGEVGWLELDNVRFYK